MKLLKLMAAFGALLMAALLLSPAAAATYPADPNIVYFGDAYCAGNCYYAPGQLMMYSSNNRDRLAFGGSGNFAGYHNGTTTAWFNANTAGVGFDLAMQDDCNVVVYDSGWNARWSSNSNVGQHVGRCRLTMGGDGHFSVWDYYDPATCGCSLGWVRIITWGNGA